MYLFISKFSFFILHAFLYLFLFSHLTNWPHCETVGLKDQKIAVNVRRMEFGFAVFPNPRLDLHICDSSTVKYVVFAPNGPCLIQFFV
jgi:hypothetical protein